MFCRGAILLFIFCHSLAFAIDAIDIAIDESTNITSHFEYSSSKKNLQSFPDNFRPIKSEEFHHRYTSDYVWLKAKFTNSSHEKVSKYIYFSSLTIGELFFYTLNEDKWDKIDQFIIHKDRDRVGYFPKLKIELAAGQEREILIRRYGIHHLDTKITFTDKSSLDTLEKKTERLYTFYIGFVVALLIFNFIIFLLTWDKDYLIYTGFIFSVGTLILLLLGAIDGIYIDFELNNYIGTFSSLSIFFAFAFSYSFLKLGEKTRKAKYFFIPCAVTSLIAIIVNQTPYYFEYTHFFGIMIDINIALSMIVLLCISSWLVIAKKDKNALIYTMSWLFMFGGGFIWLGVTVGVFPVNFYSRHALLFGNIVEMLVLSSALAYKYNFIKEELRVKQEIETSREKYKKLLRVLSHDIANSLFIISGYTKRFKRRPELFDSQKSWEKIEKATIHMERILDTVKAEQALERDQSSLEVESVNLKEIISDVVELYNDRIKDKEISLMCPLVEDKFVRGNYSILVHQVFGNILSNAIKFSENNGSISVNMERCNKFVTVKVSDTGIGMNESDLISFKAGKDISSKIGTNGEKGTGFGMYLIQSYIKLFEGEFEISSTYGKGTEVSVSIPHS